jgi:hypothetical protein
MFTAKSLRRKNSPKVVLQSVESPEIMPANRCNIGRISARPADIESRLQVYFSVVFLDDRQKMRFTSVVLG